MLEDAGSGEPAALAELLEARERALDPRCRKLIELWPTVRETYGRDEFVVRMRDKEVRTKLYSTTLSGSRIPKVALPAYEDEGEILKWLLKENVPGSFPFTAGVFSFKREGEDPTRMFAGEGDPFRTNARFKLLSKDSEAKRLSTAFDSVTLYGFDPDLRPDIYGKIGNAGVSVATLDDIKALYDGFALCDPATSVSMTINGPAPSILAMFFNAAIDQQLDRFVAENGRKPTEDEADKIRDWVLENVRGTVQADILKEDQGQNTCIFSTEFALRMMADIQDFFVHHRVRNFYSVSISGYHIAEAGANPITQLAFTLANGFTYVEAYLARGMHIDDFGPNLSFFFSAGMDPEYTVMGRVARRIWATAMRFKYGASERSQKLKYHTQTSGRSLHAQEYSFNDIRTTLQALLAIYDNTNSLHTNAYDEAITTPTEESVRRAMAIQLIINREWGLAKNENPNQGSFILDELTDLVEAAVLDGVLPDQRAGRGAGRHGDRLPAGEDPGGVALLRAQEARRQLSDHRRQHLPQPVRRGGADAGAGPLHRRRRSRGRSRGSRRSRRATPQAAPEMVEAAAAGGDGGRERLRRADGRGPGAVSGADHHRAVRGRRPVPPEHVAEAGALGRDLQRALVGAASRPGSLAEKCARAAALAPVLLIFLDHLAPFEETGRGGSAEQE